MPAHQHPARNDPARTELRDAALAAAAKGWHVFPCAPGAKHPGLKGNWQDLATTDPARIRAWWGRKPWNIGIACAPSGLVVLDLDVPGHANAGHDTGSGQLTGAEELARLCDRQGQPFPEATFTVRTPSGGTHLYFTAPAAPVGNSASKIAPLVDVRATGGYIIAPGSRTPAGPYTIINPAPPAPFPAWIQDLLNPDPETPHTERISASPPAPRSSRAYAEAALTRECTAVATAPEKTRNNTLNRSAFNLGQLIADGRLPEKQVTAALTHAALAAGLEPREIAATLRSGLTAGQRHPRHLRLERPPDPRAAQARPPAPHR